MSSVQVTVKNQLLRGTVIKNVTGGFVEFVEDAHIGGSNKLVRQACYKNIGPEYLGGNFFLNQEFANKLKTA